MCSIPYRRVEFFGGGRELLKSPNILSIRPKQGGYIGPDNRHLQNDARNRFRSAQARSHSSVGRETGKSGRRKSHVIQQKDFLHRFGALRHAFARQLLAECGRDSGADSPHRRRLLFAGPGDFDCFARQPANTSEVEFPRDRGQGQRQCRSLWRWRRTDDNRLWILEFRSRQPKPITQLLPSFILIKA